MFSVPFSADGARILSAAYDTTVWLWCSKTDRAICAVLKGHADHGSCGVIFPDGVHITSGSVDRALRIWDTNNDVDLRAVHEEHMIAMTCVAFSVADALIAAGLYDGRILV